LLNAKPIYLVFYSSLARQRYLLAECHALAIGLEKPWGGEQIATNSRLAVTGLPIVIPRAPLPIGKDDFLRGHFEFQFPLAQDFLVAANFFHDFEAVGGFRNDIGVEIRLAKLFYPRPASK